MPPRPPPQLSLPLAAPHREPALPVLTAVSGPVEALFAALLADVQALQRRSPLAQQLILVPTRALASSLEGPLQAALGPGPRPSLLTPESLVAQLLLEVSLPGPVLGPLGSRALMARAIAQALDASSYFGPLRDHRRMPGTLLRVLQECERAGADAERLRTLGVSQDAWRREKLADLARLMEAYQALRAASGALDAVTVERQLRAGMAGTTLAQETSGLFLLGFDQLPPMMEAAVGVLVARRKRVGFYLLAPRAPVARLQRRLRRWLTQRQVEVIPLPSQEDPRPETLRTLSSRLFGPLTDDPGPAPEPSVLSLVSAADPAGEVRAIAQGLLSRRARGRAWGELAVVFRQRHPWALLVEEIFSEYHIPFTSSLRPALHTVPWVRAFRTLLALIGGDEPRGEVMALMLTPWLRLECWLGVQAAEADVHAWDALTRAVGITRGESWGPGLKRLHRWKAPGALEGEEGTDDKTEMGRRQARLLELTLRGMRADLGRFPVRASLGVYARLLEELIGRCFREALPEVPGLEESARRDRLAREEVLGLLEELRGLSSRGGEELSWFEARALLEDELLGRPGPAMPVVPGRVRVLEPGELRGVRVPVLFVGGLVHGGFPGRDEVDPVLLHAERAELNQLGARLDLADASGLKEKALFLSLVEAAGEELIFSRHRADMEGREQLPSPYEREVWKAFFGRRVFEGDFQDHRGLLKQERTEGEESGDWASSWELGLIRRARMEEDETARGVARSRLAAWLSLREERARAFHAELERWKPDHFGIFDGMVGSGWRVTRQQEVLSASRLELVARCPFRFLAGGVWKLEPLGERQGVREVKAPPRGTLYHRILHLILAQWGALSEALKQEGVTAESLLGEIDVLVERLLTEFEAEQPVGYPALWASERARIKRDVTWFVRGELEDGAGWRPWGLEVGFGNRPEEPPPLEVPLGDGSFLKLRGRIDRVDVSAAGGQARVLDYKTGKDKKSGKIAAEVQTGLAVQLPLYVEAAKTLLPQGVDVEGSYYYYVTADKGKFNKHGLSSAILEGLKAQANEALGVTWGVLERGAFFPWPGDNRCALCDYQALCRRTPKDRFEKKGQAPGAAEWIRIHEKEG